MISIIIPVYNVAPYLDECIASVVKQTYTDWECILVDDGSTDGSDEICDKWHNIDNRISVVHQKNAGVSAARNHGIEKARGEYITFIDSDDWVESTHLQIMVEAQKKYESDVLIASGTVHFSTDGRIQTYNSENELCLNFDEESADCFLGIIGLLYGPCCKLYSTTIIRKNAICFPVKYSLGEDILFNFKYLEYIRRVVVLPFANYHYRILPSSNLTLYRQDRFDIRYYEWTVQVDFLKRHEMWNEKARQIFGNRLWDIVYEGIFIIKKPSLSYLKHILSIPEHNLLISYSHTFETNSWIKNMIKNKRYFLMYLIRKMR